MTDEQLEELEKRAHRLPPISIVPLSPRLAEWISVVEDDRRALLAEVLQLRERETTILERVQVADDELLQENALLRMREDEMMAVVRQMARAEVVATHPTFGETTIRVEGDLELARALLESEKANEEHN